MLLVVFCLMLAEGLDLLITIVVVFSTDFNKIKKLLVFAWGKVSFDCNILNVQW